MLLAKALRRGRLFGHRARGSLTARSRAARARIADRWPIAPGNNAGAAIDILPWGSVAVPPGDVSRMPWACDPMVPGPEDVKLAAAALAHRFRVLASSGREIAATDPVRRAALIDLAADLPAAAVAAYRLIDWHSDFHSGYTWDPTDFYLDVRVAPVPGADIKTPWELSRFQHVGALARGPLEEGGIEFLLQVLDWITANPVRRGVNWRCAMDVALRAVNWIWGLRLFEPVVARYPTVLRLIGQSLHEHGRHIENNLEYSEICTSNHYLSDIAGLLYIGAACPDIPEADRWLLFGLQELVSEMEREVYPDGAAHEASTHYHRLVAELFASCAALAERVSPDRRKRLAGVDRREHRVRPRLRPVADSGLNLGRGGPVLPDRFYAGLARMAEFTAALTKPNGLVPQLGDNDSGRVHKLAPRSHEDVRDHSHLLAVVGELLDRSDLRTMGAAATEEALLIAGGLCGIVAPPPVAIDPRCPTTLFPNAGIAVLRQGRAYLVVTCGPNGQGGLGGHGHNDKNSFELNVGGMDFIVDGGCPFYLSAPELRNRYRATAAHSTVSVDGDEQDRWPPGIRGLFRLPERSEPRLSAGTDGIVTGSHGGFGAIHERRLRLDPGRLVINDYLEDTRDRSLNFNMDPQVVVKDIAGESDCVRCELVHQGGLRLRMTVTGVVDPQLQPGSFGVGYGEPVDNAKLSLRMVGPAVETRIIWDEP